MKTLVTSAKAVATKVRAAVAPKPKKVADPWLSDDERKAEINSAAERRRAGGGWLDGRGKGWLKGR